MRRHPSHHEGSFPARASRAGRAPCLCSAVVGRKEKTGERKNGRERYDMWAPLGLVHNHSANDGKKNDKEPTGLQAIITTNRRKIRTEGSN
uniref:Uncharacterized protein n=1 Tax=Oryza punctata TaxID=4537 RepID=A0A0E0LBE6_ORYPU